MRKRIFGMPIAAAGAQKVARPKAPRTTLRYDHKPWRICATARGWYCLCHTGRMYRCGPAVFYRPAA